MNAQAPKRINTIVAVREALDEALAADPNVIVFGEDVGDREGGGPMKCTLGLSTKYGDKRVRTTPISEQAIVGAAIGAALGGLRPVAEVMMMNFTTVAMDQIVNHAAKLRFMSGGRTPVPITIRTMSGPGIGVAGQHSDMLEAWFAHTAGIKVVAPSSPAEAKGLLLSCIFDDDPCIFIENTSAYGVQGPAPEDGVRIPLGVANVARTGSDVTLITYARPVRDALEVANKLAGEGISVEVIDLRTIAPYDRGAVIASVEKTGRAIIIHEAVRDFGVGAEIAAMLQERLFGRLKTPVRRLGGRYSPVPFSQPLEAAFVPTRDDIETAIKHAVG